MARKAIRQKGPVSAEEQEMELVSDSSDVSDTQMTADEASEEESGDSDVMQDESDLDAMSLDDESEDELASGDSSDTDVDVASALIPTIRNEQKAKLKANKHATSGRDIDIDSEDDDNDDSDDDAAFIAQQLQSANKKKKKSGGFQSMGLSKPVFNAILKKGYKVPTPIQRKCIPLIMEGRDVVGMARTGSGKTAAFLIPMLEKLKSHSVKVGVRGMVLSPSRELAMQTQKAVRELARFTDLRSCVIVGGDSLEDQFRMIAGNPDILIATPGRLLHLIVEMELDLRTVEYVVFDEADRLFEMGFSVQLHEILHKLPPARQTLLFSATLPKMLVDFAKAGLQDPTLVRLDTDTKISRDLEMAFFALKQEEKDAALLYLLRDVIKAPRTGSLLDTKGDDDKKKNKKKQKKKKGNNKKDGSNEHDALKAGEEDGSSAKRSEKIEHQTIVFVATKHHVEYIYRLLSHAGYAVSYIYGSLDQVARRQQIDNFRRGHTGILVVTDVAARGIDIPVLEYVINYDFVDGSKVFVHRVGRAARAGRRGWAYSLIAPDELPYLIDLQLFLARPLKIGTREGQTNDYAGEMILGTLPHVLLEDDIEWTQRKISEDSDLQSMYKVVRNAYKMYYRSRARAASESYKRAKALLADPTYSQTHPLLANQVGGALEAERANLIAAISNFRPPETIFEIGNRGKSNEAGQIVRQRRSVVDAKIEAMRAKKAAADAAASLANGIDNAGTKMEQADEQMLQEAFNMQPSASKTSGTKKKTRSTARDEEFYLSHYQKDANTEKGYSMTQQSTFAEQARAAVLDFTGEDEDTMKSQRYRLRWDSKKKKFVKGMGIGADNKKMVRTESGALIPATYKSGRYTEWQEKTKINVPRVGEQELPGISVSRKRYRHNRIQEAKILDKTQIGYERQQKKLRKQAAEGKAGVGVKKPTGPVKNELKTATQIRKEREAKERRRAKTGRHKIGKAKRK